MQTGIDTPQKAHSQKMYEMMPATPASFTCCIMFSFSSPFSSSFTAISGAGATLALRAAVGWLWLAATKRWVAGATPRLNDAVPGSMAAKRARQETRCIMGRRVAPGSGSDGREISMKGEKLGTARMTTPECKPG